MSSIILDRSEHIEPPRDFGTHHFIFSYIDN